MLEPELHYQEMQIHLKSEMLRGTLRDEIMGRLGELAYKQGCAITGVYPDKAGYRTVIRLGRYITDGPLHQQDPFSVRGLYTFELDLLMQAFTVELPTPSPAQ